MTLPALLAARRGIRCCSQQEKVVVRLFSTKDSKEGESYFERKAAAKEARRQAFLEKQDRIAKRKTRREGKPRDVLKNEFQEWWSKRIAYEEMMDRRARQAGMPWKIKVAAVLERLPVVLPDMEPFEIEYDQLLGRLGQYGKEYPKEFVGEASGTSESAGKILTEEELFALLPEGFTPAPRETEADKSGKTDTLERRLKEKVYLLVKDNTEENWTFPTVDLKDGESLVDAAKRAIAEEAGGSKIELYCPSNSPIAVDVKAAAESEGKGDGCFGVKTFFVRIEYDEGVVDEKKVASGFAWLAKDEIVTSQSEGGGHGEKFYQYAL